MSVAVLFTQCILMLGFRDPTDTIQGGDKPSEAGLLPRTLDVIFNSIEGMHSMCNVRLLLSTVCLALTCMQFQPSRLTGVEASKPNSPLPSPTTSSNPATPRASLSASSDSIPLSNLYECKVSSCAMITRSCPARRDLGILR